MNLRENLRRAEERLTQAGIADAKNDAWLLFSHVTGLTRAEYFMSPARELSKGEQEKLFRLVEERATHRPLQHIIGTQDFMGLTFCVNEHVLIPRQDTEILVEKALGTLRERFSGSEKKMTGIQTEAFPGEEKQLPGIQTKDFPDKEKPKTGTRTDEFPDKETKYQILDLCTGSGCIAVSLAVWAVRNSWPVEIAATDISEEALKVAQANAETILKEELSGEKEKHDIGGRSRIAVATEDVDLANHLIRFRQGDLFDAVGEETFSMILSNPPYIRTEEIETLMPEVRDFEPRTALDGEKDGLAFYRRIAAEAPAHLEQGGELLLEIGCDEAREVCGLLAENGFCDIRVFQDYAGLSRVVYGRYDLS